ncbi:MAG: hypothetical protein IPK21_22915 [Haliscomenobacter sp.]|nr:hypothetical protein [Haliscomenobacter sp.]
MIRAEKETEVEVLFSRYAKAGYPLGHRDEVEEYLNSRDPERQIRALLQKARNLEREQKMPEVLEALEQAAALGSYKALEEQVRIFAILGEWEKAIASGAA